MEKTKPAALRLLEDNYAAACNAYVAELTRLWDIPFKNSWIEPAELYDFGDTLVFDMKTIRYIVNNGITYDQVQDWQEYVFWAGENSFDLPTLREYVEARVPLVPHEAQQRISEMRRDLMRLCDEERNKMTAAFLDRENMTRHLKD